MENTIKKNDRIKIKDNLMDELIKAGFNEREMQGFVNNYKGTVQTAYDIYFDTDNETKQWWVSIDLGCEIPLKSCEKID